MISGRRYADAITAASDDVLIFDADDSATFIPWSAAFPSTAILDTAITRQTPIMRHRSRFKMPNAEHATFISKQATASFLGDAFDTTVNFSPPKDEMTPKRLPPSDYSAYFLH